MVDFNSVLKDADQLSPSERLKLIGAIWDSVPPESELELDEESARELERRIAAVKSGTAVTIPWIVIRDEASARIERRKAN